MASMGSDSETFKDPDFTIQRHKRQRERERGQEGERVRGKREHKGKMKGYCVGSQAG